MLPTVILKPGELYVLTGPNGSGKSTLALKLLKESKLDGSLFLSFQQPVSVPGVSYVNFLRLAYNSRHPGARRAIGSKKIDSIGRSGSLQNDDGTMGPLEFYKYLKEQAKILAIPEEFLSKDLNCEMSGGEKKKMEIFQALVLKPKLAIFDEPDSGVDSQNLKLIIKAIKSLQQNGTGILVITHNKNLVKSLNPTHKYVMS